mgnify:CR=1 FL=1
MKLLILLTGNKDKIFKANNLNQDEFKVIKLDEKELAKPGTILSILKKEKYDEVNFGCIELILQRFHTFMKIYIFLSFIFKGSIIDEQGNKNKFNFFKLLFIELPALFFEILASFFAIAYYYVRLPIMKSKLSK